MFKKSITVLNTSDDKKILPYIAVLNIVVSKVIKKEI